MPQPAEQARRRTAREALGVGTAGTASPGMAAYGCPFAARCPLATDVCRTERPPLAQGDGGTAVACHHAGQAAGLRLRAGAA